MTNKCPFSDKSDDIQLFLEGEDPFKGCWKYVNGIRRFQKDCKNKCPNHDNCGEWVVERYRNI